MGTPAAPGLNQFTLQDPYCPTVGGCQKCPKLKSLNLVCHDQINSIRGSSIHLKKFYTVYSGR